MKQFEFDYVDIRRVILDACENLFNHEKMIDVVYKQIDDAVEDFLDEHIKEGE